MTTFRELMTVIHADRIILNHMNKSGTTYICNAFSGRVYKIAC